MSERERRAVKVQPHCIKGMSTFLPSRPEKLRELAHQDGPADTLTQASGAWGGRPLPQRPAPGAGQGSLNSMGLFRIWATLRDPKPEKTEPPAHPCTSH